VAARSSAALALVTLLLASPQYISAAQEPGAKKPAEPAAPSPAAPRLVSPAPQADTPNAADEAAGQTVNVTLGDNFISRRLPFDVPFNIAGTAPTTVRDLALSVYRIPSDDGLAELIKTLENTTDCATIRVDRSGGAGNAAGDARQQSLPRGTLRVSTSSTIPAADGRFSLFVNALDPQYYYAFCFVGTTPVPAADINDDVRRIVAATIPRADTKGDITLSVLESVRGAMSDRIAQFGAGRAVPASIPEGNLFHPSNSSRGQQRFGELLRRLIEPYGNMEIQANSYRGSLQELTDAVAEARTAGTARLTTELVAALPAGTLRLPTRESAITGTRAFDRTAYSFDSARAQLDKAMAAAMPGSEELKALNGLARDLQATIDAALAYGVHYDRLRTVTNELMTFVELETRTVTVTIGSSVLGADLTRSVYVSLDAGIAYPWRLENMVFYAGTNIYLRPINKAAPLRYKGTFLHRFALTIGITTTVQDKSRRAQDLRATPDNEETSNSLLLGAGFRVTPSIRVGGGVLVFKESDPNPLIEQSSVSTTPYVSFAADVDVARLFKSLVGGD
jgi:hypothetical protein